MDLKRENNNYYNNKKQQCQQINCERKPFFLKSGFSRILNVNLQEKGMCIKFWFHSEFLHHFVLFLLFFHLCIFF